MRSEASALNAAVMRRFPHVVAFPIRKITDLSRGNQQPARLAWKDKGTGCKVASILVHSLHERAANQASRSSKAIWLGDLGLLRALIEI